MEWIVIAWIALFALPCSAIIVLGLQLLGILSWLRVHLPHIIAIYLNILTGFMIYFLYQVHNDAEQKIWWLQCFLMVTMVCFIVIYFLLILIGMNNFRKTQVHNHIHVTEQGLQFLHNP